MNAAQRPSSRLRSALPILLPLLGFTGLVMATYWRLWIGPAAERRVFGWDCLEQFWPDLVFQFNALRAGELPLWNPYHRGGYPYVGEPFAGLYYPPQWLLLGVAFLLREMPNGMMSAKVLGHLVLGSFFLYLYGRSRGAPAFAAFLGGLVYSLSGYIAYGKDLALWTLSWLPLILLLIDRVVARPTPARGAALGAACGVAALASPPVAVFHVLLVSGPYLLFRLATAGPLRERGGARPLAAALGLAGAVALGLGLVLYAPEWELVGVSDRGARTLDYVMIGSLPPGQIIRLLLPGLLPGGAMYVGVLPFLLCAVGLACPPKGDRTPQFFGGLGLFALLLATGSHSGVLERLAIFTPGFDMFRVAERYLLILGASTAVLCTYGGMALCAPRPDRRGIVRGVVLGGCVYLAVLVGALIVAYGPRPLLQKLTTPEGIGLGVLATAATLAMAGPLLWSGRRPGPVMWTCLIALTMADLWSGQKNFFTIFEKPRDYSRDAELRLLPGADREWRLYDEYHFEQRVGARRGVRDFYDYYIAPLSLQRYVEVIERARLNASALHHFNVRWMLHGPHHRKGLGLHTIPTASVVLGYKQGVPGWIYEASGPVAQAVTWYGRGDLIPSGDSALDRLLHTRAGTRALIEQADASPEERAALSALAQGPGEAPAPVAGKLVRLGINSASTEIDAPAAGLVVLNEVYYPGWEATIDGRPAHVLRANYLLRAVLVQAGKHTIEWRFRPLRFRLFFPIYLITLGGLLAWAGLGAARHLRRVPR